MSTSQTRLLVIGFLFCISAGVVTAAERLPPDYWRQPLAPQGEAPRSWTAEERSLAPESCGACHSDTLEEWRTSLHARAFSPGLVGQLLTYDAADTATCMQCHAPMAEQREAFEAARRKVESHPFADRGLAGAGNSCGGCHLRSHRRFGPPQRDTGAIGPSNASAPHGGVTRVPEFEKSEFCAACHQFPQSQAINGKPLENTLVEWEQSPAARSGTTCQSCHMPQRKHLWRGIHDPDMVRSGLTPEFVAEPEGARFRLTSTGIGHAFPTYVTPKVIMKAVALDDAGRPAPVPVTFVKSAIRPNAARTMALCQGCLMKSCGAHAAAACGSCSGGASALVPSVIVLKLAAPQVVAPSTAPIIRDHTHPPNLHPPKPIAIG